MSVNDLFTDKEKGHIVICMAAKNNDIPVEMLKEKLEDHPEYQAEDMTTFLNGTIFGLQLFRDGLDLLVKANKLKKELEEVK